MGLFQDYDEWDFFIKAVSISDKEIYDRVRIQSVTEYMKRDSYDALRYVNAFTKASDSLANFYRHGKWDYIDGLPEVTFTAPGVVLGNVTAVLQGINGGQEVNLLDATVRVPNKHEWIMWLLQEYYGYNVGDNVVNYNGRYYYYGKDAVYADENEISFRMSLHAINKLIEYTTDITETYVTSLNDTTDVLHTVVRRNIRTVNGVTNSVLSDTTNVISYNTQNIPKGTGTTGTTVISSSHRVIQTNYPDWVLELPSRNDTFRYIAKYVVGGRYKYWIYDPLSGAYPSLIPAYTTTPHEVYPIVAIRRVGHNINDDANSTDERAKRRYVTTEELLRRWLNLNLDDITKAYTENNNTSELYEATFLIGICPSDPTPIIANVLYAFFDYIFDVLGYSVPDRSPYWDNNIASYVSAMNSIGVSWTSLFGDDDDDLYGGYGSIVAKYNEENYGLQLQIRPDFEYIEHGYIGSPGTCIHYVGEFYVREEVRVFVTPDRRWYYSEEPTATVTVLVTHYDMDTNIVIRSFIQGSWTTTSQGFVGEITTYEELERHIPEIAKPSEEEGNYADGQYENIVRTIAAAKFINRPRRVSVGVRLVVRKQINETEVRAFVIGHLNASYNAVSRKFFFAGANLGDENLVIPLPIGVVERLTPIERTKLMGVCYYLFFWSAHHTHLAWYETPAFGKFIGMFAYAIAAFVTLWSWGSAGPAAFSWASALQAAAKMVVAIGVSLAVDMLLENVDNIAIKIIAKAITAIATAYVMGGFQFDSSFAAKLAELPAMAGQVFANDVQKKTLALSQEMSIFNETYQGRAEALAEEMKSLNSVGLSSMGIVSLTTDLGLNTTDDMDIALFSPSQFRMMAIDGHRNYDLLYTGFYDATVHKFCKQALRNGLMPEDMAEE